MHLLKKYSRATLHKSIITGLNIYKNTNIYDQCKDIRLLKARFFMHKIIFKMKYAQKIIF